MAKRKLSAAEVTKLGRAAGVRLTERDIRLTVARMDRGAAAKAALLSSALVDRNPATLEALEAVRDLQREVRALKRRPVLTLEDARKILTWCNSYSRLPELVYLASRSAQGRGPSRAEFLTLFGELWSVCDNLGRGLEILTVILPDGAAPEMMTADERAALAALPETVTVYRGADRGVNEHGLSWSLDRAVAARFPFLMRYRAARPVLLTATVRRDLIVAVKLDRQEVEVITKHAAVSSVVDLEPAPYRWRCDEKRGTA